MIVALGVMIALHPLLPRVAAVGGFLVFGMSIGSTEHGARISVAFRRGAVDPHGCDHDVRGDRREDGLGESKSANADAAAQGLSIVQDPSSHPGDTDERL